MTSVIGSNIHHCAKEFGFSLHHLSSGLIASDIVDKHYLELLSDSDVDCAARATELIMVRDGHFVLTNWSLEDINSFIYCLITT